MAHEECFQHLLRCLRSGQSMRAMHLALQGTGPGTRFSHRLIGKSKDGSCSQAYKLTEIDEKGREVQAWVVKLNAPGVQEPWDDVKLEYEILDSLYDDIAVPQPIYNSSENDAGRIGTHFIVMEYVKGKHFNCIKEVPQQWRSTVVQSMLKELAKLHYWEWTDDDCKGSAAQFWHVQSEIWDRNYKKIADLNKCSKEYRLFTDLKKKPKPSHGEAKIIHGDMDISNVIFDDRFRVKAIIDWKTMKNGDPMTDVASLCMMFLQPRGQVSGYYRFKKLDDLGLLIGPPDDHTPSEEDMLEVYRAQAARNGQREIQDDIFHYAKAVACMRFISIIKVALQDELGLKKHSIGQYMCSGLARKAIECLALAGHASYKLYAKMS